MKILPAEYMVDDYKGLNHGVQVENVSSINPQLTVTQNCLRITWHLRINTILQNKRIAFLVKKYVCIAWIKHNIT